MTMTHSALFGNKITIRTIFITPLIFLLVVIVMSSKPEWGIVDAGTKGTLPIFLGLFAVLGFAIPLSIRLFFERTLKNDKTDFGKLFTMQAVTEIPVLFGLVLTMTFKDVIYFFGFFVLTYLFMFWNFMLIKQWEKRMEEIELRNRLNG